MSRIDYIKHFFPASRDEEKGKPIFVLVVQYKFKPIPEIFAFYNETIEDVLKDIVLKIQVQPEFMHEDLSEIKKHVIFCMKKIETERSIHKAELSAFQYFLKRRYRGEKIKAQKWLVNGLFKTDVYLN